MTSPLSSRPRHTGTTARTAKLARVVDAAAPLPDRVIEMVAVRRGAHAAIQREASVAGVRWREMAARILESYVVTKNG